METILSGTNKGANYRSYIATISHTNMSCFSGQSPQTSLQSLDSGTSRQLCDAGPGAPIVHRLPGILVQPLLAGRFSLMREPFWTVSTLQQWAGGYTVGAGGRRGGSVVMVHKSCGQPWHSRIGDRRNAEQDHPQWDGVRWWANPLHWGGGRKFPSPFRFYGYTTRHG